MSTPNNDKKVKKTRSLWKNKYKKKKDIIKLFMNENLINKHNLIAQTNSRHLFPLTNKHNKSVINSSIKSNLPITQTKTKQANPLPISPDNSDNDIDYYSNEVTESNADTKKSISLESSIPNLNDDSLSSTNDNILQLLKLASKPQIADLLLLLDRHLVSDFSKLLPQNVLTRIFQYMPLADIYTCMTINKRFKELIEKDDILWDYIDKRENFFNIQTSEDLLTKEKRKLCTFVEFKKKELLYRNWTKKGCLPAIKTVVAHDVDVITCLEITPEYVITAADDTFIKVYDLSGEKQTTLKGHEGGVWALKYDLETNFLITAGTDRSIRIWDLSTFKCIYVFKGHTSTVRCLELSSNEKNGKFILSGSRDSNIMVWRLPSEACQETEDELVYNVFHVNPYYLGTLKGHTDSVRSMSVYKNILVTGSYDGTCRIWNISDLRCICRMVGNGSRVYAVVYDHKRNKVYSTTTDFKIFVWEVKNYKNTGHITRYPNQPKMLVLNSPALILQGHAGLVGLLELKGDILCSAAADGSVKGWDINNFNILFQYYHNGNIPISSFWFDDNFLILGSEIQFTVVNIRNGDILFNDTLHFADNVWGIKSDGKRIYTAIVKDHKSYLSVLDFTKLEKKPPHANMYPNVLRGSLSVSKEYMFRRRLSPQRYLKDNQENSLADECDTPLVYD